MPGSNKDDDIQEMHEIGRSMPDKGFFEFNVSTMHITWANEHAVAKLGYSIDELQTLNLFQIIPEEFHESMRTSISDLANGRAYRFNIRPYINSKKELVWWYLVKLKTKYPYCWFRAEYLNTTELAGSEYSSMSAAANTTNGYNELFNKFNELRVWTEEQVERLGVKDAQLEAQIGALDLKVDETLKASRDAADHAIAANQAISHFKITFTEETHKQTQEILRLISTDAVHAKQIETFQEHVKLTTKNAMNAIETSASVAGKGLAKKISIPVGFITAFATIVQLLIQFFMHR